MTEIYTETTTGDSLKCSALNSAQTECTALWAESAPHYLESSLSVESLIVLAKDRLFARGGQNVSGADLLPIAATSENNRLDALGMMALDPEVKKEGKKSAVRYSIADESSKIADPLDAAGSSLAENSTDIFWKANGNCAHHHPSVFFPNDGVGVEVAKEICKTCPVISLCLEFALSNGEDHGVWGGASERQRRRIAKARAAAAQAATKQPST